MSSWLTGAASLVGALAPVVALLVGWCLVDIAVDLFRGNRGGEHDVGSVGGVPGAMLSAGGRAPRVVETVRRGTAPTRSGGKRRG